MLIVYSTPNEKGKYCIMCSWGRTHIINVSLPHTHANTHTPERKLASHSSTSTHPPIITTIRADIAHGTCVCVFVCTPKHAHTHMRISKVALYYGRLHDKPPSYPPPALNHTRTHVSISPTNMRVIFDVELCAVHNYICMGER